MQPVARKPSLYEAAFFVRKILGCNAMGKGFQLKKEFYDAMREDGYVNEHDCLSRGADEYMDSIKARIARCGSIAGSKEFY